jgi:F0F1-type ATP synthase alpha subunit
VNLHAAGAGLLDEVPLEKIAEFESRIVDHLRTSHPELYAKLSTGARMDEGTLKELSAAIESVARTLR